MNNRHKIAFFLNIVLSIILMIIIFSFSMESGTDSANRSGSVKEMLLALLSPVLPDVIISFLDEHIRQIAHFTLYFALGITSGITIREWRIIRVSPANPVITYLPALPFCVLYAISDEIHQYYVPGRSCRLYDIGIDTLGAALSISILIIIEIIIRNTHKKAT